MTDKNGYTPYFYSSNADLIGGFRELVSGVPRYTKAGNIFARDLGDVAMMALNSVPETAKLVSGHMENRGIRRPIVEFVNDMRALNTTDRLMLRYANSWPAAAVWGIHNLYLAWWDSYVGSPRTMYSMINLAKSLNVFKDPRPFMDAVIGAIRLVFFRNPKANIGRAIFDYFNGFVYGLAFAFREWADQAGFYVVNRGRSLIGLSPVAPHIPVRARDRQVPRFWKEMFMPLVGDRVVNNY